VAAVCLGMAFSRACTAAGVTSLLGFNASVQITVFTAGLFNLSAAGGCRTALECGIEMAFSSGGGMVIAHPEEMRRRSNTVEPVQRQRTT